LTSTRAQEAIRLRTEEKLTYQQIGDRLGITRQGAHLLVNPETHRAYQREQYRKRREAKELESQSE
jgi:predicted DNA-binding protein (UPF0251 family)